MLRDWNLTGYVQAVVVGLWMTQAVWALPTEDGDEKKKGQTTVKGSYKVYDEGGTIKIRVDFSVKKTGVSGTGKGVMVFEILNDSFEPAFKFDKGFTVGSDALTGANKKEFTKTLSAVGPAGDKIRKSGVWGAITVEVEKDSRGVPTSPDEWKQEITDWTAVVGELKKLGVGQVKAVGNWRFTKIK